ILPGRGDGIRGMRGIALTDAEKAEMKSGLLLSLYPLPVNYPAQPDFRLIDSLFSGCSAADKISAGSLPGGNTGAVFEGYINAKETKKHEFSLTYKGGVKLYIDGRLVADGPYDPKSDEDTKTAAGSIILEKGYHKIRVEYAECRGEKPVLTLQGDYEFSYITPAEGLTELPAWSVDFSTMKDQKAYSEEGAPAGIYDPYIYLQIGYTAYLGKVDLSKLSRVEIVYCCDGSDITRQRFESSSSLAIGLKSEDSTYGVDRTDNFEGDIAHTDMVFSERMWATGARTAVIDLTGVTYSGDVWLSLHNPAGTFIGILKINFFA
ncbi:MAG: hypothetical protein J5585_11470, partial [Clostridia bacterium]|nr:hypothetical protein [Clostridia bacterium]